MTADIYLFVCHIKNAAVHRFGINLMITRQTDEIFEDFIDMHIKSVGNAQAALTYLAPYLYRIAISNANILACHKGWVTFRYRYSNSGKLKTMTLSALEFMRRYLQHVLPKGFQKVRYFGFLHPKNKILLNTNHYH